MVTAKEFNQRSGADGINFLTTKYATAIYRSELAFRLKDQGYDIERGKRGQPEIRG